jgi:hypothetical protein
MNASPGAVDPASRLWRRYADAPAAALLTGLGVALVSRAPAASLSLTLAGCTFQKKLRVINPCSRRSGLSFFKRNGTPDGVWFEKLRAWAYAPGSLKRAYFVYYCLTFIDFFKLASGLIMCYIVKYGWTKTKTFKPA